LSREEAEEVMRCSLIILLRRAPGQEENSVSNLITPREFAFWSKTVLCCRSAAYHFLQPSASYSCEQHTLLAPLAVNEDEAQDQKERYDFPYGDFDKVHRSGLIPAQQRAGQYNHNEVEKAADELTAMSDERESEGD
jgi:hypothetical protein